MLNRWASGEFSTDWGTRDISPSTRFYDPISYHQGSVWPLFTGWVSLAEYRAGRPQSGYAHLMQNADLTWAQDLGSVTELLSGEFFQPLGRSSSHQLWSSAMVITPLLRGLFGLRWDALHNTLQVNPALPADWNAAKLQNLPFAGGRIDIKLAKQDGNLRVQAEAKGLVKFCLTSVPEPTEPCTTSAAGLHTLTLPLQPVEIGLPHALPLEGAETAQLKVLDEDRQSNHTAFTLAAMAGSTYNLPVRVNRPGVRANGAQLIGDHIQVDFPKGTGYQTRTVTFTW
jgi:hypothetical protein